MDPALRQHRETLVRRHMQAENDLDFETVMRTFAHPRYELIGTERTFDGDAEVRSSPTARGWCASASPSTRAPFSAS
jgi:hypothetical protein